jgi:hypothetical protein
MLVERIEEIIYAVRKETDGKVVIPVFVTVSDGIAHNGDAMR